MTTTNAFGKVGPAREIYDSEPNIIRFMTSIHGEPRSPVEKPKAVMRTGRDIADLNEAETELTVQQIDNGEYSIAVSQDLVDGARVALINIEYEFQHFGVIKDRRIFDVSRRLMDFWELNSALGEENAVDYLEFSLVEKNVRKIIESYCNQQFRAWDGTHLVEGYDGHIVLPEPIESLESVRMGSKSLPNLNTNIRGYKIGEDRLSLFNPDRDKTITFFKSKPGTVNFTITGRWGYSSIPTAVHLAAIELAKTFLCDDIEYRRRYLESLRFGDTRLEFADGAYEDTTGNPIADQMLDPYRAVYMGAV